LDLAEAFASECFSRACPCLLSVRYENIWLKSILKGSKEQLESVTPQEKSVLEETDFYIFTMGPRNPIPWGSIPPEKRGEVSVWLDPRYDKSNYARKWRRIAKANKVKMLAIEATLATPERAEAQGLDSEEWFDIMLRGCIVDHEAIAREAKNLSKIMSGRGRVDATSSAGTLLNFDLDSRHASVSDGILNEEMVEKGNIVFLPAGAIEVSVDEESAEGRIAYDHAVWLGNEKVEGLVIELKDGLIVKYSATRGSASLERYLKKGGSEAGRFSYFGFGLNPYLRYGFTQDDKVLGGLTIGFGDNRSMGGKNQARAQWWATIMNTTIKVDGHPLLEEGELLV